MNIVPVQLLTTNKECVKVSKRRREHENETENAKHNQKKKTKKSSASEITEKLTTVCPNVKYHRNYSIFGCFEETNYQQLNENGYLYKTKCFKCNNVIVHKLSSLENNAGNETLFNNKCPVHSCECFQTRKDVVCDYCICKDCHEAIIKDQNDNNNSTEKRNLRNVNPRRSGRNNK